MTTDEFSTLSGQSWVAPASSAAGVTPNDSTDLSDVTRWIYVGGVGNLAVIMNEKNALI